MHLVLRQLSQHRFTSTSNRIAKKILYKERLCFSRLLVMSCKRMIPPVISFLGERTFQLECIALNVAFIKIVFGHRAKILTFLRKTSHYITIYFLICTFFLYFY